jgi:hypothetical protein
MFRRLVVLFVPLLAVASVTVLLSAADRKNDAVRSEKPAAEASASDKDSSKEKDSNKEKSTQKNDKKKAAKAVVSGFTEAREAAALAFVRANHPELVELLEALRGTNTAEYQRAIRELFQTSERLADMQQRSPQRYDLELQDWKVKSRIQVLLARLTVQSSAPLEEELRSLLTQQLDIRRQLLLLERDRLTGRLADIETQLNRLSGEASQEINERVAELLDATRAAHARQTGSRDDGSSPGAKNKGVPESSKKK